MESRGNSLLRRLGEIARGAGRVTLEALQIMGAGFGAANDGEAGLRLSGAIAMGNPCVKECAEQMFTPPDYVPQAWVDEQRGKA